MKTVEKKATEWTEDDVVAFLMEGRTQPDEATEDRVRIEEMLEHWGRSTSTWMLPMNHNPVERWICRLRRVAAMFL